MCRLGVEPGDDRSSTKVPNTYTKFVTQRVNKVIKRYGTSGSAHSSNFCADRDSAQVGGYTRGDARRKVQDNVARWRSK
jgi:hypothetical protein